MKPHDSISALALTMIGEARGEGDLGMIDVGHAILNRLLRQTWYGLTVLEVCMKPKQFSCWNDKDPNRKYLLELSENDKIYKNAEEIASDLLEGLYPDETHGATHYKVIGTPAVWANGKTPCFVRGHHEFFNNID